jgi:hypothetical protein
VGAGLFTKWTRTQPQRAGSPLVRIRFFASASAAPSHAYPNIWLMNYLKIHGISSIASYPTLLKLN